MRTGLGLLAAAAALALVWLARGVLLLAFLAVVLAVVLSFPVRWLARLMPRGAAVMVVLVAMLLAFTGALLAGAPALSRQLEDVTQTAPRALKRARHLAGTIVATPALVCVQTLVEDLWVERKLGK